MNATRSARSRSGSSGRRSISCTCAGKRLLNAPSIARTSSTAFSCWPGEAMAIAACSRATSQESLSEVNAPIRW